MITPFEDLLHGLGPLLGVPLHLDPHGACCLQMNEKLRIQIEPDKKLERIITAAFIGELSPGRFREEVLKEALKANALYVAGGASEGSLGGILGFSAHHNQLACHRFLVSLNLTADKLLPAVALLTEYALSWQEALQNGQTAPLSLQSRPSLPTPFGIRP